MTPHINLGLADLQKRAEQEAEDATRRSLIDKLASQAEIDMPEAIIEREIDKRVAVFRYNLMHQGLDLDRYLGLLRKSLDELRYDFRGGAVQTLRQTLSLQRLAELEQIEPGEDDMEQYFIEMAAIENKEPAELKESMESDQERLEECCGEVRFRKVIDFLAAHAVYVATEEEAAAATEAANQPDGAVASQGQREGQDGEHDEPVEQKEPENA